MESLLHHSRAMCPFLNRTSPAVLRTLSIAAEPRASSASGTSPGGGAISNLQVIARRCPVMSKALAVQSARMHGRGNSSSSLGGARGGSIAMSTCATATARTGFGLARRLHTSRKRAARVDGKMTAGVSKENVSGERFGGMLDS